MATRPDSSFPAPSASGRKSSTRFDTDKGTRPPAELPSESPVSPSLLAPSAEQFSDSQFFRRTLLVAAVTVLTGVVLAMVWYASDIFLLFFGGVLVAVLLRAPTNWLSSYARLSESVALTISILVLIGGLLGLLYLFAVPLAEQLATLIETLPQALSRMRTWLSNYDWARPLQPLIVELSQVRFEVLTLGRASWIISSTMSAMGGLLVVLFIGIYLAAQPRLYQRGLMHLLPRRRRPRAYELLDEIGMVLRWWLVGRLVTMTLVGAAASLGLWWLGIPLAFTLGVLSGLLEFVPYVGPVLAAVSPLLIAFNLDPELAFYVLLLYVGIQMAEGYLLTPLIEQRAVSLPPALVVFSTILLAALAGPVGVVLASPLTATFLVAVKLLYVEDIVEQSTA